VVHVVAKLKDGRQVVVRSFQLADKEGLIRFYESLSDSALRWALPPYTRERLEGGWLSNLQNLIILVAVHENQIVGHAQTFKFPNPRRKGVGDLVIYLHQDFHNQGLGTAILGELIKLAKAEGLHRLGLHVVADNKPAVHLYEKFDFKTEGVLEGSYFGEDGRYHDEIAMG
jgi:RimJ/RimL family protein N-acetyltransferase